MGNRKLSFCLKEITVKLPIFLPVLLFAFFMVFGRSYEKLDNWSLVLDGNVNRIVSIIQYVTWTVIFYICIAWLFKKIEKHNFQAEEDFEFKENFFGKILNKYFDFLQKYPIRTIFITFFITNIPYIFLSYPAIFMGDTNSQLGSFIIKDWKWTAHHPVAHTFFMGICVKLHSLVGWNKSIFLVSIIQTFFLWFVICIIFKILVELKVNKKIILFFLLYYLLNPRIHSYQFLMTKDILYTSFLTLFFILFYGFVTQKFSEIRFYIFLFFSILGIVLFRNDGKFFVIISCLAALFLKGRRKISLLCIIFTIGINLIMTQIIFPAFKIEKGSKKEMLSVPFQQTARYLKYYGNDVTEEEKIAIEKILDYKNLAKKYNPNLSDPVKGTAKNLTKQNLKEYFNAWFKMFLRHPGPYFQATMNNYYQYFYPGKTLFNNYSYDWGAKCMENVNKSLKSNFHFPKRLEKLRKSFELLREAVFSLPIISIFRIPAFYSWMAILLIFYVIYRRKWIHLVCCVPIIVQFLIFITGPTNGYYCRYQFPMLLYLPIFTILILIDFSKERSGENTNQSKS